MQQQDLAGAMLLFDDINQKGFEGDLVVNGFAEFIRNLLVCKDEKAAVLLEAVDSFRNKYIETAKKTSFPLLISTLNILNDTEINYKAARNKRLHVELGLIKLCYLQQAIELSADTNGINKKKIVDSAKPVAFKAIKPFEIHKVQSEIKHTAQSGNSAEAKLIIETSIVKEDAGNYQSERGKASAGNNQKPTTGKIAALDKIRKQYQGNGSYGNGHVNHPLQIDTLQKAWDDYVQKLKETKNSAAQSFALATLKIKDDNCFEVTTANNIEQKFIEQDRNKLFVFLQEQLHNRLLQFSVIIEEPTTSKPKFEPSLTATQQFQKMTEMYPMVKELKDRLKLDLDY
jgi:DNA polymerase-3 subunit gamma/tau